MFNTTHGKLHIYVQEIPCQQGGTQTAPTRHFIYQLGEEEEFSLLKCVTT